MSKWIEFVHMGQLPEHKTTRWAVVEKDSSGGLGEIAWFTRWRKYCFWPDYNCVFEERCLRDIAAFCEQQTKAHREAKKNGTP